jgi:hypothetical protein
MNNNDALQEIYGDKSGAVAKLLATVAPEQRGMLALSLAVGQGHGEGARSFRSLAALIISQSKG